VQGYADVVYGLPKAPFDELTGQALGRARVEAERELDYGSLRQLTRDFCKLFGELTGEPFPADPFEQLSRATIAVFRSWDAPKAVTYRKASGMRDQGGTAATIQRMVFGNMGGASGSGVAFTRNPATGIRELYLDFEFNAQGEDVVSGRLISRGEERLHRTLPSVWMQLDEIRHELETLFHDAQDFEFTLQNGELFLLQTRPAKRTPWAALRIAVDQVDEGLITSSQGLAHIADINLASVVRTRLAGSRIEPLVHAQVASMGVGIGAIALDSEAADQMIGTGTPVVLVRREAATADIRGIMGATGILTSAGGRTSHAAVVARQLSKVCLVGCPGLEIDLSKRSCRIGGKTIREGEFISLDGNNGGVYEGQLDVITERPERELARIAEWHPSPVCG
jgi:pyruvate,orthophosphate dikinase